MQTNIDDVGERGGIVVIPSYETNTALKVGLVPISTTRHTQSKCCKKNLPRTGDGFNLTFVL